VWIADNVYEVKSRATETEGLMINLFNYFFSRGVSMFMYTADDLPICFDTGISENTVEGGFDAIGFKPEHVKQVFLTHSDRDHVGGLNLFKNADVFLSVMKSSWLMEQRRGSLGMCPIHRSRDPTDCLETKTSSEWERRA